MFSSLLLYSIKSAIVLSLLYLPYMLMLRRESFFRFNRMMLLGILFLSLLLPLCNIPWMSLDHQPVVQAAQVQMLELGIPVHVLPEVQVMADGPMSQGGSRLSLFMLVSLIYIIGMAVLLILRLWQVGRLQFGLRRGALWQQEEQGIRIYCHAEDVAPFSWMRSIVISQQDYDEAGREIMLHEIGHIQNGHSWDVVLLTLVQMLQWWNPLAYALGISLRDVHEFEADDYVLRQGVSAQSYQLLLIKKAVGSGSYAFANSFNHSLTKKRITMMKKIKSNPWMRSKALYVIPVAALALSAFATPKFVAPIEDAVTKLEGKDTEVSANLQTFEEEKETRPLIVFNGQIFEVPEDAAKGINFRRMHEEQLTKLLNINVEDVESIAVLQEDAAIAKFGDKGANGAIVINTKKKDDIKELVKKLPGAEMDDDGNVTVNGKSVAKIMLDGKEVYKAKDADSDADKGHVAKPDSIWDVVAVNASYPGGDEACFKFIAENVRYPKLCQEYGVQGRVIISFVIEKDGSISNIKKLRAPGHTLSEIEVTSYKKDHPESTDKFEVGQDLGDLLFEEGKRVLELMPKWEPAKDKDGNIVRCHFNLPIQFRLNREFSKPEAEH